MDTSILKKLGLSDKEIKVYVKLLQHGAISVRNLADLSELNRGSTYDILKKLQEVGLVSYYHQDTKQKFVAESPDKLISIIKQREEENILIKDRIRELIPELKSLQDKEESQPVTKFYEGRIGVRSILEDVLFSVKAQTEKEYYVYSAVGVREDIYNAFPEYNQKRVKYGIKAVTISLSEGGGTYGLDERRWMKHGSNKEDMTYIVIYANKCAFIARDANGVPVGVIIENKMIYETQKMIFLHLWDLLK